MQIKKLGHLTPSYIRDVLINRSRYAPIYLGCPERAFPPLSIYLAVNSVCNAHCVMCDVGQANRDSQFFQKLAGTGTELSKDVIFKLIDEVKSFKPRIFITSTEPLIYRDLFDVIAYIVRHGMFISVTTNGILLKKYAAELVASGLHELLVSLDGIGPVNDRIRGQGVFERAVAGMDEVKRLRGDRPWPQMRLNYVVSDMNAGGLMDFYRYFDDFGGIESISFSHLNFVTPEMACEHNRHFGDLGMATAESLGAVSPGNIDFTCLWDQIETIRGSKRGLNVIFNPELSSLEQVRDFYADPWKDFGQSMCRLPWMSMQILSDGTVTISTRCFDIKLGNIHRESFQEIWYGDRYKDIRAMLYRHKKFPACYRCCGVLS